MADLSITATNVAAGSNVSTETKIAAAAIAAGEVVYLTADGKYGLADTDSATALVRKPRGIALNSAAAGQPVQIAKSGDVTLGSVLSKAVAYYLSGTPGKICPVADVAAGDYTAIIGMAISSAVLRVDIQAPDIVL
jgi:hypothetical protein